MIDGRSAAFAVVDYHAGCVAHDRVSRSAPEENALIDLPVPPMEFRRLVGPTDPKFFDNPNLLPVFPGVKEDAYASVFDFGCGCGRLARQLIQQHPRPARYLGVDRHRGMIAWCQQHLTPLAPGFAFQHHDVFHDLLNPAGTPGHLPFPVGDAEITLLIAWSVFTHLLETDAHFYMQELGRVLGSDGVAVTTWFLFDKGDFPMMQEFQNSLMINAVDPTNAVIFDRGWFLKEAALAGLVPTRIVAPDIRGFAWVIHLEKQADGRVMQEFPEDLAPRGIARPPIA
jgi:SAM-dependent methyltransferase